MGVPIPGYRALRGSLRRLLRTVVIHASDMGVLSPILAAASALGGRNGVWLEGVAAGFTRRNADQTAYWRDAMRRFPGDPDFLRRSIEAGFRSGRIGDAPAGLAALIAGDTSTPDDARFVLGLSLVYQRRNDTPAIVSLTRTFLKGLQGSPKYRLGALRLSRLIFAFFGRARNPDPACESRNYRACTKRMLERSGASAASKEMLERVVRCEQVLASESDLSLLDTDVSRAQCERMVRHIRSKLAAQEAFSLVRIGDGEAACLPYEPELLWLASGDARERERIWWGKSLKPQQSEALARRVFNATWSADCIGVPTFARFLREIRLREDDRLDRNLTGRGLRAILYAMERYRTYRGVDAAAPVFTSCHLHQDLAHWDLYGDLLRGIRGLVTVSCHPDLAGYIEREFDAGVNRNIVLPPDRVSGPALGRRSPETRALPDMIDEIAVELARVPPGSLVLVGAGYPGKWFVDIARAGGNVALDVGSVFDYWLGLPTRSYLDFPCV